MWPLNIGHCTLTIVDKGCMTLACVTFVIIVRAQTYVYAMTILRLITPLCIVSCDRADGSTSCIHPCAL